MDCLNHRLPTCIVSPIARSATRLFLRRGRQTAVPEWTHDTSWWGEAALQKLRSYKWPCSRNDTNDKKRACLIVPYPPGMDAPNSPFYGSARGTTSPSSIASLMVPLPSPLVVPRSPVIEVLELVMEVLLLRQHSIEHRLRVLFTEGDDNGDGVLSFEEFNGIIARWATGTIAAGQSRRNGLASPTIQHAFVNRALQETTLVFVESTTGSSSGTRQGHLALSRHIPRED